MQIGNSSSPRASQFQQGTSSNNPFGVIKPQIKKLSQTPNAVYARKLREIRNSDPELAAIQKAKNAENYQKEKLRKLLKEQANPEQAAEERAKNAAKQRQKRAEIKSNPELAAIQKAKDSARYLKRKEEINSNPIKLAQKRVKEVNRRELKKLKRKTDPEYQKKHLKQRSESRQRQKDKKQRKEQEFGSEYRKMQNIFPPHNYKYSCEMTDSDDGTEKEAEKSTRYTNV